MQRLDQLNITLKKDTVKFVNQRQELIQQFVDKINKDREGTKYSPVKWTNINGRLHMMKEQELYMYYRECERADIFSKRFFGGFKVKKSWSL